MKSYSAINLLKRQRNALDYSESFFESLISNFLKSKEYTLKLNVSHDDYLRMDLFCRDIVAIQDEYEFSHSDLVQLLLEEYINSIRVNGEHSRIYSALGELERKYHSDRGFTNSGNTFYETYTRVEYRTKQLRVEIDAEILLRAECVFQDLEISYPDHGYTVETFLEFLYADFSAAIQSGNTENVVATILRAMKNWT